MGPKSRRRGEEEEGGACARVGACVAAGESRRHRGVLARQPPTRLWSLLNLFIVFLRPFFGGLYAARVWLSFAGGVRSAPARAALAGPASPSASQGFGRSFSKQNGKQTNKQTQTNPKNYNLLAAPAEICMECFMGRSCVIPSFCQPALQNKLEGCFVFLEGG